MKKKILCIAHRGSSAYKPENTLAAFEKAIEQHADCIELDVQITKDAELVVYHDVFFKDGSLVREKTLAEVKYEGAERGIDVPSLDEVLYFLNNRIKLNIEIKATGIVDALLGKLKLYDRKKIICSSFIHEVLIEIRQKLPTLSTALISCAKYKDPVRILDEAACGILVQNHEFIDQAYVDLLHRKNKLIFAFTVNNRKGFKRMIDLGVDGIFTDYPDLLKSFCLSLETRIEQKTLN